MSQGSTETCSHQDAPIYYTMFQYHVPKQGDLPGPHKYRQSWTQTYEKEPGRPSFYIIFGSKYFRTLNHNEKPDSYEPWSIVLASQKDMDSIQ